MRLLCSSTLTDLMNRAIDKPAEHLQIAGHDVRTLAIRWQQDKDQAVEQGSNIFEISPSEWIPLVVPRHRDIPLELVSSRSFPDRVVHLHYSIRR